MNKNKNFNWTEELIQEYLDNKNYKQLNTKDNFGNTGFMKACLHQPELAKKMLEYDNIDFNLQDKDGETGFMMACLQQPELAKKMFEYDNIDFNLQDNWNNTGFMYTCLQQPELMIPMLNNKKINTSLKNKKGMVGYELAKQYNSKSLKIYNSFLEHEKMKQNNQNNRPNKSKSLL